MSSDNALDPRDKKRAKTGDASYLLSDGGNKSFDDLVDLSNDSLLGYLDDTRESSGSDDDVGSRDHVSCPYRRISELEGQIKDLCSIITFQRTNVIRLAWDASAKAAASQQQIIHLQELLESKCNENSAAKEESSSAAKEINQLRNLISAKDKRLNGIGKELLAKTREMEEMARETEAKVSKLKDIISSKDTIISLGCDKLAKRDSMIRELNKFIASKNAECLALKNEVRLSGLHQASQAAAQATGKRNPMRCMRCGNKKARPEHKSNASSSAVEFCLVPAMNRTPFWRVPPGYNIGDTCAKEKQADIAKEWRKICKENGYEDSGWEGWGRRY